jgi:hypothetical protein
MSADSLTPGQPLSEADVSLLPCPFCGTAVFICEAISPEGIRRGDSPSYDIDCDGCGLWRRFGSEHDAIAAWNRRPHAPVSRPGDGVEGAGPLGEVPDSALKIATDLHAAYEQLIYGLPKYLDAKNLTDEENMIREAYITLDVTAHRIAALTPPAEPVSRPAGEGEREEMDTALEAWLTARGLLPRGEWDWPGVVAMLDHHEEALLRPAAPSDSEMRDAISLILPLAKGYAAAHPVGSNQAYVDYVESLVSNEGDDVIRPVEPEEIKAAYQRGWNDREADIIERTERIAPQPDALAVLDRLLAHSGARGTFDAMKHGDAVKEAEALLQARRDEPGASSWPEVTDAWAETYCALTGKDPDGQQVTFVDGGTVTTFRDMARREIEAMLCAAPKSAVRTIATAEPAEARIEGQANRIAALEKLASEQSLRVMQQATRAADAEKRATAAEAKLARAVEGLRRIGYGDGGIGTHRAIAQQTLAALQQEGE